ncbi:MAG: hypothetical protein IT314_11340 [Anaerolineales bacterium]|nr:hypothetical protein [Anaerolineales bacterium]
MFLPHPVPLPKGEGIESLRFIGEAEAPNIVAQTAFAGHLAARDFDEGKVERTPFKVERVIM